VPLTLAGKINPRRLDMELRRLGRTGLSVSALGFGCGAIGGLMVRGDHSAQRQGIGHAIEAGVRYFDTAPGYGDGRSEENLGRVLRELRAEVVVGTKVRLTPEDLSDIPGAIRRSLEASLRRLQLERVELFQLHNRIGNNLPGALAVEQVLGPVVEGLEAVREAGLIDHYGITATGDTTDVRRVVESDRISTAQVYMNVLNPSAGWAGHHPDGGQDFAGLIDRAAEHDIGVINIRPLAAGAVAGTESRHDNAGHPGNEAIAGTVYRDDLERAGRVADLAAQFGLEGPVELAFRFALAKPGVSTVLVGFSDESQLTDAIRWAERGPLPADQVAQALALSR
jgi:aryl-alcohol dehydrogenase-like predicted oxidoreductase